MGYKLSKQKTIFRFLKNEVFVSGKQIWNSEETNFLSFFIL